MNQNKTESHFENVKAFADYIRKKTFEYSEEPDDLDVRYSALRDRYGNEIQKAGFDIVNDFSSEKIPYQKVLEDIGEDFKKTLPDSLKQLLENHFYFTTISNRNINASISRSEDGRYYAIYVNSTLITAMTRFSKLQFAIKQPDQVFSCSRYPDQKPSLTQLQHLYEECLAYFIKTKLPKGPLILLQEPLNSIHLYNLRIKEMLIVFHELGHFLNEDLELNDLKIEPFPNFKNISYQRETFADLIGFGLMIRQIKLSEEWNDKKRYMLLLVTIDLYQLLHLIQGIETEKYPHPLNRMGTVISFYFGSYVEEWVGDAILNNNIKNLSYTNFKPEIVQEGPMLEFIERQIFLAFSKLQARF